MSPLVEVKRRKCCGQEDVVEFSFYIGGEAADEIPPTHCARQRTAWLFNMTTPSPSGQEWRETGEYVVAS